MVDEVARRETGNRMTFDELHSDGCLKGLPLRATLNATGQPAPSFALPEWELEYRWVVAEKRVLQTNASLRCVRLGNADCCVVLAEAITPGEGNPRDEDYRALVYVLNPADRCVWTAIDSWVTFGSIATHEALRCSGGGCVTLRDLQVLKLRDLEGEELESDVLAGEIQELLKVGKLESELARQLGIKVPLYCAIVETPMMLKSMQPVNPEEWRLHKEHEMNRWLNEGIAS